MVSSRFPWTRAHAVDPASILKLSLVLILLWPVSAQAEALGLDAAVETALAHSPRLEEARAELDAAEGRVTAAGTYPHNPEVEGALTHRSGGEQVSWDWEVGFSQTVELAGQTGRREEVARGHRAAAAARLTDARRRVAAEVHLVFTDAVEARELLALARAEAGLANDLFDLAQRRLEAGASTRLEVNVAAAEVGRSEQGVAVAEAAYAAARARLAETVGLAPGTLADPMGPIPSLSGRLPGLEGLLAAAESGRADLTALRAEASAAEARVGLARSAAWPSVEVGAFLGREEGTDRLAGLGLAIPLPLFDRNQGAVAEARAERRRAEATVTSARLGAGRELVAAFERHRALRRALGLIEKRVLGSTEQNLALLRRSYEAGKASWMEVLFMRQSLFEARRALLTTRADTHRSRVALELAAGRSTLTDGAER